MARIIANLVSKDGQKKARIHYLSEHCEYQVLFCEVKDGGEYWDPRQTYYTDDKVDAVGTANYWIGNLGE